MRPRSGKGWGISLQRKPFPCEFVRAKGRNSIFLSPGFIFRIITRLETLATEARWGGGVCCRGKGKEREGGQVLAYILRRESFMCIYWAHCREKWENHRATVVQGKELNTDLSTEVQ